MKKFRLPVFTGLALLAMLYLFFRAPNLNPLYAEGASLWATALSLCALAWFFCSLDRIEPVVQPNEKGVPTLQVPAFSFEKWPRWVKYLVLAPWVLVMAVSLFSSVFFNYKAYRDQLGEPEIRNFSSEIQMMDISQVPVVDQALAAKLADKKLGERPSLGSQVVLGEPTIQQVNGKLVWVVPLHHSGFFKWLSNLEGTPGYVVVSATNVNDVEYVENFRLKYQPGSFLLQNLTRHVRFSGAFFTGLTDYSFELDDSGQPYWVISTYRNRWLFALPEATGAILVNATTGETRHYPIDSLPGWVDRVQPEAFIRQQIYNQGEYVHGFLNFSDRDKFKPSKGQAIVYNNGRCYLFTGLTSVGSDESAIGFMMVDMVTKTPYRYQINGATEEAAQSSAQGKVQHLGYTASFPIILNIEGEPTYFMTLKDREGLVKQYSFVSVVNYSVVGVGETMSSALRDYQQLLGSGSTSSLDPDIHESYQAQGTVLRIASENAGDGLVYLMILAEQPDTIFSAAAGLSPELALTQPGDPVSLTYYRTPVTPLAQVTAFDNTQFTQQ